ncbi:type III PLP-dependent enzyme [Pseudaquidulcibacter saccharophilus]|uniref:type III PLP-dependent enzyme n=1 Tax=Pseudaquidulcibacter saccharophilus TaxID=2831900 RepID=UPI001EFF23C0|nr:type III PLP-dependent enzyme [Pseudaquidulcibacter saccharophilus]
MNHFNNAIDIVAKLRPDVPVAANRPHVVKRAAKWFLRNFAGDILYAVKANPSVWVLDTLWEAGVRNFDVASINEIQLIYNRFKGANLAFMHPVKNRNAIARAYHEFGVRTFSLDSMAELEKIREATGYANDLNLLIRLSVSNTSSSISLDGKFGIKGDEAVELLRAARAVTREDLGICFHVGSQCMDPHAYVRAMDAAKSLIIQAGVVIDILDVGGGFPVNYRGINPPDMKQYMSLIAQKFESMPVTENCSLWCEPGRALVAEATSIITRVELVKGDMVYLNDGAYGNLFDATHVQWPFETRHIRADETLQGKMKPFKLYGPTCDSIDALQTEYYLHEDVKEGDYIEFMMLGAYGVAMTTGFNGFGETLEVISNDLPHVSMFDEADKIILTTEA